MGLAIKKTKKQRVNKKSATPQIGDIWVVAYPELYIDEDEQFTIRVQKRPFLVLDDGRGLIIEENDDYHCFKLTTKSSQRVKCIDNWKEKGLKAKSYYRIEMPIKVENQQFLHKITEFTVEEMVEVYKELYNYLNVETIEKLGNE